MFNYGPEPHDGWLQVGNIHGDKYATWVRELNGYRCVISRGLDRWTWELGLYWAQMEGDFYDSYKTFDEAEARLMEESRTGGYRAKRQEE